MASMTAPFRSPATQASFMAAYDQQLLAWPVPFETRYIPTRFGPTHVVVCGPADAPPLLLLHGFHATAMMWRTTVAELSRHYRCYMPDTPGDVGKTVLTAPVRDGQAYVVWLQELMDGLEVAQANVAGLSYGGFLTSLLALHAPERVRKAVLLCPAGTLSPLTPAFFLKALPAAILKWTPLIRWYWRWFYHHKERSNGPDADLFVAGWKAFQAPKEFVVPTVLTDGELRRFEVPVTVLIGEHEVIYKDAPAAVLARAQRLIPGAQCHLVPGAGHIMTADNPAAVMAHLLEGLA